TCSQNVGSVDLSVSPTGSYTYLWSNGATTEDLANIAAGSYAVTTTSTTTGCTGTASATVANTTINLSVTGVVTQPTGGQNNGAIDLTVSPTGTYDYLWSNGATTEDVTGLGEGTYTVTVSAGGSCTATASFVLAQMDCDDFTASIELDPDPPFIFCYDDPIFITATAVPSGGTGPYSYYWGAGQTTPSITFTEAPWNVTYVTITDDLGCTATASVHIKSFVVEEVLIEFDPVALCQGDTLELSANLYANVQLPNTTYLWSTNETTPTILVTSTGTYSVTVDLSDIGCVVSDSVDITFSATPDPVPIIDGPTFLCPGQSATLSVTNGPFNNYFWWPGGSNDPTFTITDPGVYNVYVENAEGCSGISSIDIPAGSVPPELNNPAPICPGQSTTVEVTNASQFESFSWSNNGTGPSITVSAPGTYTVTVTASGGCTATGSADVIEISSNMTITGTATPVTSCIVPNGAVNITVTPTGTYEFDWSNGPTTEDLANIAAGSYTVTVTDAGGCTATSNFAVANNTSQPALTATPTASTCGQGNGAVDLSISPTGSYTFFWSNGATTEDLTGIAAGNYAVTVTAAPSGCTATASTTVPDNSFTPNIAGTASPNTTCIGSNGSIATTVSPSNTYSFNWSNGETSQNISGIAAGTYSVTVSAGGNCTNSASFVVEEAASLPTLSATIVPAVCGDPIGEVDLTVSPAGSYSFLWSNGAGTEDLADLPPGNYSATVTSVADGCTATGTFNVPNNSTSFALSGTPTPVTNCGTPNGEVDLTVSPSGTYTFFWSNGLSSEDLTGLPAGQYTVTVTQSGACTGEASFQVGSQVVQPLLSQNATPASCGLPNGAVDLGVAPSSGNTFAWSNGASSEDLQNVPSGTYAVTVTSANGCTATASATVPENTTTISLAGTTTANTSCTAANGGINLTASPSGSYTFIWSNGATTEDLQNVAAGSYAVTVSAGGNCTSTATFAVPNNSGAPTLTPVASPAFCGFGNGNIDLTVSPSGVYTFVWSNGATTEDLQNIAPGNYSVTVTGANGCTTTASLSVPNNNTNFALTATPTASTSCVLANGQVNVSVSPSGVYGFVWSNGATSEDLSGIASGSYTVTVTDASGCSDVATVTVGGPVQPQVAIVGPAAACAGEAANLAAAPGFASYLWSNGQTGSSITVSQPGVYAVTATDMGGCTATANQVFGNLPLPVSDITGPASICGGSTQFTVSGGVFAQTNWSNGAATPSITVSQPGIYSVTVTDGNGCTASASQNLLIGTSLLPAIVSGAAGCSGTASLDAGPGYASYLWSNGSTGQNISVSASGTYAVTVSDGSGCTGEDALTVNLPAPPQVSIAGENSICTGGSTALSVPNVFAQTNWNTGETTPSITVSQPGVYGVTVTDANGCTATDQLALSVGGALSPDIVPTLTDCDGTSTLDAGAGYASYLWSNGSTLPSISVSANGAYAVTVTDASGCTGTAVENLVLPTPPQVQVTGAANLCEGDETVLAAPGNFVQYLWSTGETMPEITISQGGVYSVTVSDANDCTASGVWTVTQMQADFVMLQASACSPLDTGTVQVLLTNQFGCDSLVVTVTVLAQPVFATVELGACAGGSAVFNGVAIPAGSSQEFVFAAANGCDSVVSVNVVAFPEVSFYLAATKTCWNAEDGTIEVSMLSGKSPYQYSLDGSAFQTEAFFDGLPGGSHSVVVEDANGCVFSQGINVPQSNPTQVLVEDVTISCEEGTATLRPTVVTDSPGDLVFSWPDGSNLPWMHVGEAGVYDVEIDDGCEILEASITATWDEDYHDTDFFYIPNSFSPNGDGINDDFRVFPGQNFEMLTFEFRVFDRWGDAMFATFDPADGWDGVFREIERQPDVYVWFVKAKVLVCGAREVDVFREGGVTIMR
ncbi:MAG: gliding motility-associated C-terminal domain-containing protein, partial [Bacteroidetes bacterium]|nr:gliding motility-associated C-terminal domain-containing protein [Bacteroidota bacterium]